MTDEDVAALLDSNEPLVLVEAPAGCGKTYQGAQYAYRAATQLRTGRVLILTHTHAACGVFAKETRGASTKVEIRTIDSLIVQIATAYHASLDLPADPTIWARENGGISQLASPVKQLLSRNPMICSALAERYPIIVGDEHQDSNSDQHSIMVALHSAGSQLRIFGDPMQRIYQDSAQSTASNQWGEIKSVSTYTKLETPHRWCNGHEQLGAWILRTRELLSQGEVIDLTEPLPSGLAVIYAENCAQQRAAYQTSTQERGPIDHIVKTNEPILVLTDQNKTVNSLRAFWNRTIPIWEGHTRPALSDLVGSLQNNTGNAISVAEAVITFLQNTTVGFTPSSHGNRLKQEINNDCSKPTRGIPALIQQLGRFILDEPNHVGTSKCLQHIQTLHSTHKPGFENIKFDHRREFSDAIRLSGFSDPDEGLAEINRRRSFSRPMPPRRAISTIHKAKGLECDNSIILPCDKNVFSSTPYSRCKLYVALSRAKKTLTLVVSRDNPSPLFHLR